MIRRSEKQRVLLELSEIGCRKGGEAQVRGVKGIEIFSSGSASVSRA